MACCAYLGARAILGANIEEIMNLSQPTLLQTFDQIACSTGVALLLSTGAAHLAYNIVERDNRRSMENAEENLRRIREDYSFSRGHL